MPVGTEVERVQGDVTSSHAPNGDPPPHFVLEPTRGWARLNLDDLWRYRELLYFLVWRDIKSRYKQTSLGIAWAVLQPILMMVVFSVFFGRFAGVPSDGAPYPVFTFAALLPWQLFSHGLNESGNSLVTDRDLLTKIYFPRLVIPVAPIIAGLVDFALALVVLLGLMVYYGIAPTPAILSLPFFILLACAAALAAGLWLSALNVHYRDVRYTLPFLTQFWLFATPIAYPVSVVPEQWRVLYGLNPMVGVVEGFRWALLGTGEGLGPTLAGSVVATAVLLVGGLYFFRRMERTFADVV